MTKRKGTQERLPTGSAVVPFKSANKKQIRSHGIRFFPPTEETPEAIIDDLEAIYHRDKFYVLTSGGKDSMSVCHWLAEHDKLEAAVHIKTNIGIKETTDWLEGYCKDVGYKLYKIEPQPRFIYSSFVLQYGFPGPEVHRMIMGVLKYKPMRDFVLSVDRERHCLISGVRRFESARRMGNYPHPIQNDASMWFACPFFYKTTSEVYRYVHENGIKITPVHAKMGMSGECMCGAYATRGEKEMIRKLDPELADYIAWLEDGVQRFGTTEAKRHPTWGGAAKMSELEQQQMLDAFFELRPDLKDVNEMQYGICGEECGVGTMRGELDY